MGINTHVAEDKKYLAKNVQRYAQLRVLLMVFTQGGGVVMIVAESSLVLEVKEKQDQDPIFLELKANVHKKKK